MPNFYWLLHTFGKEISPIVLILTHASINNCTVVFGGFFHFQNQGSFDHFLICGLRRINIHEEEKSFDPLSVCVSECDHGLNHTGPPTKRSKDKETQLLKINICTGPMQHFLSVPDIMFGAPILPHILVMYGHSQQQPMM